MISKLLENNGLLRDLTTAECLSLVDSLDEHKMSYRTIYKIKLFGFLATASVFEQLSKKYIKTLQKLFTDPLTEVSAEILKQRMFRDQTFAQSELVKLLKTEISSETPHSRLSIYNRYANLIN